MKRICIIGAGNIGSRHLQGLKKITSPLSITVFDPSAESLSTARQRYDQIPSSLNHEINFLQTMEDLPKNIDLAIIATSSNVRRKVTEELLKNSTVKYLILEKILFQKAQDYKAIKKQIKKDDLLVVYGGYAMNTKQFNSYSRKRRGKVFMASVCYVLLSR